MFVHTITECVSYNQYSVKVKTQTRTREVKPDEAIVVSDTQRCSKRFHFGGAKLVGTTVGSREFFYIRSCYNRWVVILTNL